MAFDWMMYPILFGFPVAFLAAMFGRKSRWIAIGAFIGLLPAILFEVALWQFLSHPLSF